MFILSAARASSVHIASRNTRAASAIATKYAQAAYGAALKKSPQTLDAVQKELSAIGAAIKKDEKLASFVHNPTLTAKDRQAGLQLLFQTAAASGAKKVEVSDITKNLFSVLAENGRLVEVQDVIAGFDGLVGKYKGELEVVVTSAAPLPRDVLTRLETALKSSVTAQQAKSVKITNKVKPSLIGGLVVDFGDKSVDLSVSSRVNKINNLLQGKFLLRVG
ncbi:OSCP, subunit 5 of the stator stalk of mitochondrial F1F0 ATP synthase [Cantharellus anzutake]|uniref:OSCP, subunit 5 of the stator stalk of mitochondrial F1F0 ATP synthase n=1 Tax=Cantharellus anzutake TaxID=1750568 RepID=UPI001902CDB0|nr:OSCP, subunit 5 of the stator stalk of mitochondrial F1F0 ATP synthase [Cantharellus anzutake]KAF8324476.1 OSCP, subunit 5 of the stator stalk of mitochondrial F1F0 ATP synthase [Cantharellus anzutake]